jgi:hypothetical protein
MMSGLQIGIVQHLGLIFVNLRRENRELRYVPKTTSSWLDREVGAFIYSLPTNCYAWYNLAMQANLSTLIAFLKAELEDMFCEHILGQTAKQTRAEAAYNLNVLKDGPDRLDTDPEDHVTPTVRRLRLKDLI